MSRDRKKSFVGRDRELGLLKNLLRSKVASLVVIKGRRRIGKSRLAEEFGRSLPTLNFVGLAPEDGVTAQAQRKEFAKQLQKQLKLGGFNAEDWTDLFDHLASHVSSGPVLVVLDEINWMGSRDPTFLPKLKTAWDTGLSKNPKLILILSGSMSGWIEKNILSSTGFFGRVTLDMTLEELPLDQCSQFWGKNSQHISAYEKFKVLSVLGGVPRYLELIQPELSAEENIERLCFTREGILFNEFDRIFSDLFSQRSAVYKKIVQQVSQGPQPMEAIVKGLGQKPGGGVSGYLDDLVKTGYLARDYTWELKKGRRSKLSRYRLRDNYLRFYLRYIEPEQDAIARARQVTAPSWHTIMGLQFENLILNHRDALYALLNIDPRELLYDNPFFQTRTKERRGCQIDLLIQTRFNTLYLCEVKFKKGEVGSAVVEDIEEKIRRLKVPRNHSIRPVLIHVNGVTDDVAESGFFSHIIDFGQLLG